LQKLVEQAVLEIRSSVEKNQEKAIGEFNEFDIRIKEL
jgi:hypothetical protein